MNKYSDCESMIMALLLLMMANDDKLTSWAVQLLPSFLFHSDTLPVRVAGCPQHASHSAADHGYWNVPTLGTFVKTSGTHSLNNL